MDIRPILSTLLRHKTAAALIVLEIALTCAIICNALFIISDRLEQVREVSGLVENELVRVALVPVGDDADAEAQTRSDLATLRGLPGVKAATVLNQVPFVNSSWNSGVRLDLDQQVPTLHATVYTAEEQFLETFGLELVANNPDLANPGKNLPLDGAMARNARQVHGLLLWVMLGAIVLHVAGAFKHHLMDQDGTLKRMLGKPLQ